MNKKGWEMKEQKKGFAVQQTMCDFAANINQHVAA